MGVYAELEAKSEEDPDGVIYQCAGLLDKNHNDALALFLMGQIYAKAEKFGAAYNIFTRVTQIRPEQSEGWNNLGMTCEGRKDHIESMRHFEKAWSIEKKASYASNIGNCYLSRQDYKQSIEWARKALRIDPACNSAKAVLGMASLSLGDWPTGWDNHEASLGGKFRKEVEYQGEGRWDGTPGKTLIVYGEQGLGDEVMYASCVPDAAKSNTVVLECDKRLEGLFKRSFPSVSVYGTRREAAPWLDQHRIDARVSCGTLPKFFRRKPEDFPGTPYLKADPEHVLQWRALFDSWGKRPKIGIAWSGGSKHNQPQARHVGLAGLRPLVESVNADFVSLQYKNPAQEIEASGLPVRHFKRACETSDYDDTAALVAALDLVVSVPTSVVHLAGALGVKTHCLTPYESDWNFQGDRLPWYASVDLFKKPKGEPWSKLIERYLASVHRV